MHKYIKKHNARTNEIKNNKSN